MDLTLKLNARFQPKHRFELEDALQEILEKEQAGEVTGGGTAQNPNGEIAYCDIDIYLTEDTPERLNWLVLSAQYHRHPQRQRSAGYRT